MKCDVSMAIGTHGKPAGAPAKTEHIRLETLPRIPSYWCHQAATASQVRNTPQHSGDQVRWCASFEPSSPLRSLIFPPLKVSRFTSVNPNQVSRRCHETDLAATTSTTRTTSTINSN
jgi:hypothetical protein